ncbi:MAG: hypothetical protein DRN66_00330 [Candidatus Nanohalarchaeota archaeon]|nr:MAG: hypothetical protein DRN66_00330 [Candidatus Nanohaloarchaeota archaeon]
MKIMNYIVIVTMIIALALPFAVAQTDETGISNTGIIGKRPIVREGIQPTAINDGIQTTAQNTGLGTDARLAKCITYIKKNNLDRQPAATCMKLLKKEINCVQFLKGKNVKTPVAICDKLFIASAQIVKRTTNTQLLRSREAIGAGVAEKIPDWRLRRIDSAIKNNPGAEEKIKALTEEKANVFSHLSRAQQEQMLQLNNAEMQEKMKNYRLVKTKKVLVNKKRIIAKQKLLKAEKDYMIAKQNYVKIKDDYRNRYAKFLAVKKKLKECNSSDSPECEKLREQAQEHANDAVAKSAEMLINHLSKIKHRIESEENINQTRADEIIANINAAIAELTDAKTEAKNAQTKEELKDAAKKVRTVWAKRKHWENVWRARLVHAKVWGLVKRAEHLEERMDQTVANMQDGGINTIAIEKKISLYSQNIVDAKEKTKQAETLIREAHDILLNNANLTEEQKEEIKSKLKKADGLARAVNNNLKKAHRIIIEIAKDIRKLKGNIVKTVVTATDPELLGNEQYEVVETEASGGTDEKGNS